MAETTRPTAEELEELALLLRRDPASPAFVDLGSAYLALGRPREAIEAAQAGLRLAADNHEGRLVLARGHAALHQWKEAQAELLKVVKTDRTSRIGFTLLGEVLMRRADYERAVPVLQHAQNLDPGSPAVLTLLRLARGGLPLDPPPPIPTPIAPRRSEPRARPVASVPPPAVAPPPIQRAAPPPIQRAAPPGPPPRPTPPPPRAPVAAPPPFVDDAPTSVGAEPGYAIASSAPARDDATIPSLPPEPVRDAYAAPPAYGPPPAPLALAPAPAPPAPAPRAQRPSVAPPGGESVRPRVLAVAKPVNAAAASLRQSAAVGENYLNDLLTGGLLDVPGVRVPDAEYDLRPDRRWGRSTVRAFVVLFVLLVAGVGGGGYWYYFTEQQRAADVARLRASAATAMASGSYDGFSQSLVDLTKALKRDEKNKRTFAAVAESAALRTLLYGLPGDGAAGDGVADAIAGAAATINKPTQDGYRALVIARTASALTRLTGGETANQATIDQLTAARKEVGEWLTAHPDDRWARFLFARCQLAAGERAGALDSLRAAGDGPDGLVVAIIDEADLLVDDGKFDDAMKLYADALTRAPDHPLAMLGRALARAERGVEGGEAISDLNVKLPKDEAMGGRVNAYRHLALALAYYGLEQHQRFAEELAKATGPHEPRFLARVALARFLQGHLGDAATALGQVKWFTTTTPDPDALVTLVNGALQLASGTPEAALDTLGKLDGTRAELLRGIALIDLRKYKEAQLELETAQGHAPDSTEVKVWRLMAQTLASTGTAREESAAELEKTSRKLDSKVGRHAHGMTMLLTGNLDEARRRLEQALADVSDSQPNPVAYRTRVGLATIERQAGKLAEATTQVEEALKANPGYLPARVEMAKVLLAQGDGDGAIDMLAPVLSEAELLTGEVELLQAESLMKGDSSKLRDQDKADRREAAQAALERAKSKGVAATELARVAALIDPSLAADLGVAPTEEAPPPPRRKPARRRRGR